MRRALLCTSVLALAIGGCRRAPGPIDPSDTTNLAPCPAGLHLLVGLQARDYEKEQLLLRYAGPSLVECQGLVLPDDDYDTMTTVGGLPDGTDLVGFVGAYSQGGRVVRFDGANEIGRIEDELLYPISIAPITFHGAPAVAVLWGSGSGSSDHGERLDVYSQSDLSRLGGWDASYELIRVAAAPSGQADRVAGAINGGLQEYRADTSADTLPTTGELQVAKPRNTGYLRSLDAVGQLARASSDRGVLSWQATDSPAFLGPVACAWPDTTDTILPPDTALYPAAVIDAASPEDTLVIVHAELDGVDAVTHLYVLRRRGECARVVSYSSDYLAGALAWSGR